jgi:hypothetical protein
MKQHIQDETFQEELTPAFTIGAKRFFSVTLSIQPLQEETCA